MSITKFLKRELDIEALQDETVLSYFNDVISARTNSKKVYERIAHELSPFIYSATAVSEALTTVFGVKKSLPLEVFETFINSGKPVTIDTSLYKELQTGGKRIDSNNDFAILIDKTRSIVLFDRENNRVVVHNQQSDVLAIDVIRIIKSLIAINCERKGCIMLHASGIVFRETEGVLFLGDSRNGKTTILMEALSKFAADMLSCDTSILKLENDKLVARGWPSNFSVSIGTMYDYQSLHKFLPKEKRNLSYVEAWDIYDKHVLDTKEVIRSIGTKIQPECKIETMIALNFAPEVTTGITEVVERDTVARWLTKTYLGSRDPLYPNWHSFWAVDDEQINDNIAYFVDHILNNGLKFYQMNWAPGPEALLRRVESMWPYCKEIASTRKI